MNQELTARIKTTGGIKWRVWNCAAYAEEGVKDGNILTFGEAWQA